MDKRMTSADVLAELRDGMIRLGVTQISAGSRAEPGGYSTPDESEKQFTIGKYGVLHFYFDVFNLFNANTVTEFRWWLGSRYMETYDILPPRVIRIGGAWDF